MRSAAIGSFSSQTITTWNFSSLNRFFWFSNNRFLCDDVKHCWIEKFVDINDSKFETIWLSSMKWNWSMFHFLNSRTYHNNSNFHYWHDSRRISFDEKISKNVERIFSFQFRLSRRLRKFWICYYVTDYFF